jgi:hypothetical protein
LRIFGVSLGNTTPAIRALKEPTAATSLSNSGLADVDRLLVTAETGVPASGRILG